MLHSIGHPDTAGGRMPPNVRLIMQTKAKSNSICTGIIDEATGVHTYTVLGAGGGTRTLDPRKASEEVRKGAMDRGFYQRTVNAAALERDTNTGNPATPADKFARVCAMIDHLESGGTWERARGRSAGDGAPDGGLIMMGMIRSKIVLTPEEAETALAKLAALRGIDRTTMLKVFAGTQEVAAAIAAIRAERAAARAALSTVSAGDLMAEMMADDQD